MKIHPDFMHVHVHVHLHDIIHVHVHLHDAVHVHVIIMVKIKTGSLLCTVVFTIIYSMCIISVPYIRLGCL